MLSTPHEAFAGHAERDRACVAEFEALAREKASWIGRELGEDVTRARHEGTQAAIARLRRVLAHAAPDVLVVVGDDQGEWFNQDLRMQTVDYVPCYRSEAGTGVGMAFAVWE